MKGIQKKVVDLYRICFPTHAYSHFTFSRLYSRLVIKFVEEAEAETKFVKEAMRQLHNVEEAARQ